MNAFYVSFFYYYLVVGVCVYVYLSGETVRQIFCKDRGANVHVLRTQTAKKNIHLVSLMELTISMNYCFSFVCASYAFGIVN